MTEAEIKLLERIHDTLKRMALTLYSIRETLRVELPRKEPDWLAEDVRRAQDRTSGGL